MQIPPLNQLLLPLLLFAAPLMAQPAQMDDETMVITLEQSIALARKQSLDAAVALNELKRAYWEHRTYLADNLPEVSLTATSPYYSKRYSSYQLSDGTYTFVPSNNLSMYGQLSVNQNLWFTGGNLSVRSSLDFFKQLDSGGDKRFMSIPIAITLTQPIFGVNSYKWNRRIEPIRYQEAKASFISSTETVTLSTINYFFNLLLAKEDVAITAQNLESAEKLYEIAQRKREMGQISQNDLLQMELNLLDARSQLASRQSNYKNAMFSFRSFLAIDEEVNIEPMLPDSLPMQQLDYQEVLEKALKNNSFALNIQRRQLEADYSVAQAKGALRQVSLYAQVGYTGTDAAFEGAYNTLKDNQVVQIGVTLPILDWGKRKGRVRVAENNREVTENRLRIERANFAQNLFILVERFNNQQMQVEIARKSSDIAARRYTTNVETFLIGKISTLDLNDAQVKRDEAQKSVLSQMYSFWSYYYQIRSLTLWDFNKGTDIEADFAQILR